MLVISIIEVFVLIPVLQYLLYFLPTSDQILGMFIFLLLSIALKGIVIFGYYAVLAYYMNGQTIGKKLLRIKVVDFEGRNLSLKQFFKREFYARGIILLLYIVMARMAQIWMISYVTILGDARLAVHDRLAYTQVIKIYNTPQKWSPQINEGLEGRI